MSFVHGKNTAVLVDGYDLSAYFNQVDSDKTVETAETTTFGAGAKTRIPGLRDGSLSLAGYFDGADGAVDDILAAALGAASDKIVSVMVQGAATTGNRAEVLKAIETNYKASSGVGDAVTVSADFEPDSGVYGGVLLLPLTARTTTANGTAVNKGAATSNGGVGNLHCTAVSGTATPTATVKIQDSADNSSWADIATFTDVTAIGAEQKVITGTVRQYRRAIISAMSGTNPSFTIAVTFSAN